jgi:hypothetical protein
MIHLHAPVEPFPCCWSINLAWRQCKDRSAIAVHFVYKAAAINNIRRREMTLSPQSVVVAVVVGGGSTLLECKQKHFMLVGRKTKLLEGDVNNEKGFLSRLEKKSQFVLQVPLAAVFVAVQSFSCCTATPRQM